MTSVSAGPIMLTPTQPVGSGRTQRESNPWPPHQDLHALPTELPRPPSAYKVTIKNVHVLSHPTIENFPHSMIFSCHSPLTSGL